VDDFFLLFRGLLGLLGFLGLPGVVGIWVQNHAIQCRGNISLKGGAHGVPGLAMDRSTGKMRAKTKKLRQRGREQEEGLGFSFLPQI
jgi:hypothetical protein